MWRFLTGFYLTFIIGLAAVHPSSVLAMHPNEWGDFLAGTFAPLAFLWLVLGYLQQGQALRQNTEALKLQAHELRLSSETLRQQVEATNALAQHTERQADATERGVEQAGRQTMAVSLPPDSSSFFAPGDRPTPPRFLHADSRALSLGGRWFSVEIVNDGGEARQLTAEPMESGWRVSKVVPSAVVPSNSYTTLELQRKSFNSPRGDTAATDQFALTYNDVTGCRFVAICEFESKHW